MKLFFGSRDKYLRFSTITALFYDNIYVKASIKNFKAQISISTLFVAEKFLTISTLVYWPCCLDSTEGSLLLHDYFRAPDSTVGKLG